jgi:predicted RecB family endonuclease
MQPEPKKRRKIKDIDVAEISLVDFAANRKTFYLTKRRNTMEPKELKELFTEFLGVPEAELEVSLAKAKELSQEAANAIKGALNMLSKFKDELPDPLLEAVKVLGKFASYGYPAKKAVDPDIDVEKVGARLSKATLEQLKTIKDVIEKFLGEGPNMKKVKAMLEDLIGKAEVIKGSNLPPEVAAKLARLDELEAKEKDEIKKAADKERDDLKATVKTLTDKVEKLEKSKGHSAQVKDDGADDADAADTKDKIEKKADFDKAGKPTRDLFPSLKLGAPVEE